MQRSSISVPRLLVLALAAFFAVLGVWPVTAQAADTVQVPAATASAAPAAPATTADFLASLSGEALPAPGFLATGCTSSSQCPTGQLCCLACGYAGCERRACTTPINGHCPFYP